MVHLLTKEQLVYYSLTVDCDFDGHLSNINVLDIFDPTFDKDFKGIQSHRAFAYLCPKRSKVCKAVVSLNAFDARQNYSQRYWHV